MSIENQLEWERRDEETLRLRRCKRRNCEDKAISNGLCCRHYLKLLNKFEAQSRQPERLEDE